jgi:uncharacterized membrane protein
MNSRLRHLWAALISGYWFLPSIMVLAAVGLALGAQAMEHHLRLRGDEMPWGYFGKPDDARLLLTAVASSLITVASVVFSITIATLNQTANQFGPLLLRRFMQDLRNQFALGTFAGTFVYCLVVLQGTFGNDGGVPNVAVGLAVLLAILCVLVLIYFIHHVARSLQAPQVVARAGTELSEAMHRLFPEQTGQGGPPPDPVEMPPRQLNGPSGTPVVSHRSGYVQMVDQSALLGIATKNDLFLRVDHRPGHFVTAGSPLLMVWCDRGCPPQALADLRKSFFLGSQRTEEQDVEYCLGEMTIIAVRALSPGINDPETAIMCIDWLGAALCQVLVRGLPSAYRYDAAGTLRVVAPAPDFAGLVDVAFNQIRQYGRGSVPVAIRLLEALATAAVRARTDPEREALLRHVEMIYTESQQAVPSQPDLDDIARRYRAARQILTCESACDDAPSSPLVPQRHPAGSRANCQQR